MAHLQSKMCSIASSFQSSGMLIGDEEAASHCAHDRLLGAWMCPASWPFWMHDARSPCLLGNVPLRALPPPIQTNDLWPCGAIGHQLAAAVERAGDRCVGRREATGTAVRQLIAVRPVAASMSSVHLQGLPRAQRAYLGWARLKRKYGHNMG